MIKWSQASKCLEEKSLPGRGSSECKSSKVGVLEAQKEANECGQSGWHRGGGEKVKCAGRGRIMKAMGRYMDFILCPGEGFISFLPPYGRYFMGFYKLSTQEVLNKCLLGTYIRKEARREMEPIL